MSTVIGIDIGTSTTEAALIQNGKPLMIFNLDHEIITPSAVGINESGDFVVGEKARAQYLLSPENTAIEVKLADILDRVRLCQDSLVGLLCGSVPLCVLVFAWQDTVQLYGRVFSPQFKNSLGGPCINTQCHSRVKVGRS